MIRAAALAAAMLFSSAALADQTVVYSNKNGSQMTLEIADSGHIHVTGPAPGQSGIIRDGEYFLIFPQNDTVRVVRGTDMAAAMEETMGALWRKIREKPKSYKSSQLQYRLSNIWERKRSPGFQATGTL